MASIGFSYVALYTWFSAQERPAAVSRRHVLALDEMTTAEKEGVVYLLHATIHERLVELLATRGLPLRAAAAAL